MDCCSNLKIFALQTPLFFSKPRPPKTPLKPFKLTTSRHPSLARCSASLHRPAAAAALTAAAALLLSRFPSPALASPLPRIETHQHLEESDLDSPTSLLALVDSRIKSNDVFGAISALDRLADLQPDNTEWPLFKSHILIQSGDTESAKHFIEQFIDKNPLSVEAYHGLVMAHREAGESSASILPRIEAAMAMCKKAKKREDLRDFKLLKAEILVVEGKYKEAIRVYEELEREQPRDFRPYLCQGIVYTLMMKKPEAEKKFDKFRQLVPRGHPYAGYFDDNVIAMKVFGQLEEERKAAAAASKA